MPMAPDVNMSATSNFTSHISVQPEWVPQKLSTKNNTHYDNHRNIVMNICINKFWDTNLTPEILDNVPHTILQEQNMEDTATSSSSFHSIGTSKTPMQAGSKKGIIQLHGIWSESEATIPILSGSPQDLSSLGFTQWKIIIA